MSRHNRVWLPALTLLAVAGVAVAPAEAAKKVLRLRIDGPLLEAPQPEFNLAVLMGEDKVRTLRDLTDTIERAADDDSVDGLVLIVEQPLMTFAQLEEVSRTLAEFRKRGKPIHAYLDYADNLSYALACCADHITLAENSDLFIIGLNATTMYYKQMLDKIGVHAQMLHCGAYKSAVEPYTRTEPSKEAAENLNWLLDGIFERWLELMATGRDVSKEAVRQAVDQAPLSSAQAKELRLVDDVSSWAQFKQLVFKEYGQDVQVVKQLEDDAALKLDFGNPFAMFQMFEKMMQKVDEPQKPGVGLVFVSGAIMVGESEPDPFSGTTTAGSTTIRAALEDARLRNDIKAVVLRVDSPGGSALASDIIWKAATRLADEKPLIVSMGGVAASGGYYVAIPGDTILAEAGTITGSIGVLGGKLVWNELMEDKLGITMTEFTRGNHADLFSMNEQWTQSERQFMQKYLGDIYEQFKNRVRTSRGDRLNGELEDMAGGRVFTGRQALERGLVDRIGGLSAALDLAAERADLGKDYTVHVLPKPQDVFEELIAELTGEQRQDEFEFRPRAVLMQDPILRAAWPVLQALAPQQAHAILQDLRQLLLLKQERAGCFVPASLRIR